MSDAFPFEAQEGDFIIEDFHFDNGESLDELRLHYTTLGEPHRDEDGMVTNAVLIMHGTGGSGHQFFREQFSSVLFNKGQLLDVEKYYIILPDDIGHGQSSKPSDGLRAKFPQYRYGDMVRAEYQLVTEGLDVNHLRLVMGTSMGGMHTWMWGYTYPDFMDALMPLASLPVEIAGRNRMTRRMIIDSIQNDPAYHDGDYEIQPYGLTSAIYVLTFMGSIPLQWQKEAPTADEADAFLHQRVADALSRVDANDLLYQVASSRDYNPLPHLSKIKAPLIAINSADDQVNPPELGILDETIKQVKNGKYILLPITDETRGHGSHTWAMLWKEHLADLLNVGQEVD